MGRCGRDRCAAGFAWHCDPRLLIRLNTTLTKLNDKFDTLDERLTGVSESNHASHRRLWEHEEMQDSKLHDHETRIQILEHGPGCPANLHKGGIYMKYQLARPHQKQGVLAGSDPGCTAAGAGRGCRVRLHARPR